MDKVNYVKKLTIESASGTPVDLSKYWKSAKLVTETEIIYLKPMPRLKWWWHLLKRRFSRLP